METQGENFVLIIIGTPTSLQDLGSQEATSLA